MTVRITRQGLADGTISALQRSHSTAADDTPHRTEAEMAALLEEILAEHDPAQDIWVFGYGSLIWNPALNYAEKRVATAQGWHRRFCLKMYTGRGTPEMPGLMLALDRGGSCKGMAYRIAGSQVREELGLLWRREMYGGAYHARWVSLRAGKERLRGLSFVIDRAHPRYCRALSVEQTAELIATGAGALGTCREYLENTLAHLGELGLADDGLRRIAAALPKP